MQPRQEPQRVDPLRRFDRDLDPPHSSRERLVEEVEPPRRFRRDGQQLGIVRCLGEPFVGEAQGGERQTLLEVLGGTAPRDRRDLVVALGSAAWYASEAWSRFGVLRTTSKQRSCRRRRSRPSSWWTIASATSACENQNLSSLTSTTTPADVSARRAASRSASSASVTTEQRLERCRPPVDRERLDHAPAAVVEPVELLAHRLFQRPRQLGVEHLRHQRSGTDDTHQLLDDERNAGRAPVQRLDERRGRLRVARSPRSRTPSRPPRNGRAVRAGPARPSGGARGAARARRPAALARARRADTWR